LETPYQINDASGMLTVRTNLMESFDYGKTVFGKCSRQKRGKVSIDDEKILEEAEFGTLVPGEGFEPSRGCPRRILSAVRLPFRHPGRWDSVKFTAQARPHWNREGQANPAAVAFSAAGG
jgi:hypothetical protein